ncbi:MAG: hypothetical protein OHK006_22450 [Thermodesulfovibrionales bacterium]
MEKEQQTGRRGPEAQSTFRVFQHTRPFRLLLKGFLAATRWLPVWLLRCVGFFVAIVFVLFNPANFRAIMGNLRIILPGKSSLAYAAMAFGVFINYAFYLIDLFHLSHDTARFRNYRVAIRGLEHLPRAQDRKGGIILLTTHLGNWEIGGLALSARGRKICVVYSPDSSGLLEDQRRRIRLVDAVEEVALSAGGFSSLRLLRLLQEGKAVALQGDRLTFDSGVSVPFFGRPALFPKGPIKLALVSGSVILPVFIPITGYKSYEIIIEEPVVVEPMQGGRGELEKNLLKIIKIFERQISRYPTQWYTFMPFWEDGDEERAD